MVAWRLRQTERDWLSPAPSSHRTWVVKWLIAAPHHPADVPEALTCSRPCSRRSREERRSGDPPAFGWHGVDVAAPATCDRSGLWAVRSLPRDADASHVE